MVFSTFVNNGKIKVTRKHFIMGFKGFPQWEISKFPLWDLLFSFLGMGSFEFYKDNNGFFNIYHLRENKTNHKHSSVGFEWFPPWENSKFP